jgi:predicted ribosome quality control (RQC) complex YloA/Tae2 family protein
LERAASLAAFYSKLKTDSLSPVIVTEAKYVRKVKGSDPGSVMVAKEKVILVAPTGPDQDTYSKK